MNLICTNSLADTLDAFEETVFYGRNLARPHAEELARWIAGLEGKGWSYRGLPAPTRFDYENGFRTFTGERIITRAATGHMLGEEAGRALSLLAVDDPNVRNTLAIAVHNVSGFSDGSRGDGFYCCGKCTVSMWRFLSVSPAQNAEERLEHGIEVLSHYRDGSGKWGLFPFYYTLLALSGMPEQLIRSEIQYAAPTCERLLKRAAVTGPYGQRRRDLLERVLGLC